MDNSNVVKWYVTRLLVLSSIGCLSACSSAGAPVQAEGEVRTVAQPLYSWVPAECVVGTTCANQDIPRAIVNASIKYNIPRWFYYAIAHRETSFDALSKTGTAGGCAADLYTGFGLTQLTNLDHVGRRYPENLAVPDQLNSDWQNNMGIPGVCATYGLCPWIDMNNVTPLWACETWQDPYFNLDRFSSGYAAPAFYLYKAQNPAGTSNEEILRQVAYHWRYGVVGSTYVYPNDPEHYLSGDYPNDYDTYVAAYGPAVNTDDYGGGAWNGAVCTPPYSNNGCNGGCSVMDSARYNFECGGNQGWASTGTAHATTSSGQSYGGSRSLDMDVAGAAVGVTTVYTTGSPLPTVGGTQVTFRIWISPNAYPSVTSLQAFVQQDSAGGWTETSLTRSGPTGLAPGWNTMIVTVPVNAVFPLWDIGVRYTKAAATSQKMYLDSVTW